MGIDARSRHPPLHNHTHNPSTTQTYETTVPENIDSRTWMARHVHARVRAFMARMGYSSAVGVEDSAVDAQIVGGVETPPGVHSFLVGLVQASTPADYDAQFCGGTLYNEFNVITAAHCVDFIASPSSLEILVGTQDLSTTGEGRRIGVSEITMHPDWDSQSLYSDVAIVRLATPVTDIPFAQLPARDTEPVPASLATVSGWGALKSGGSYFTKLRSVVVPVWDTTTCNGPNSYAGQILASMFCAGEGGKDSCQGDSGGPITNIDNTTLIGVVSWGDGCAKPAKPGVYTRTGNVDIHDFITSVATVEPPPSPAPTQAPTRAPTVLGPGQCPIPYNLTLGTNAFNNAPASGFTVLTSGTPCNFGNGYAGEEAPLLLVALPFRH